MTNSSCSSSWREMTRTMTNDAEMNEIQLACFSIISFVGDAKSCYMQAVREAKKGNLEAAHDLVTQGAKHFVEGHNAHMALVSREADTGDVPMSLILIHAEDQLMDAESCKTYALEFIALHEKLEEVCAEIRALREGK